MFIADELMMEVGRLRVSEDGLELAVDVGGAVEILAAGDVGDVLERVIDDDCEMVGCANVFAGKYGVAVYRGVDREIAEDNVVEGQDAV